MAINGTMDEISYGKNVEREEISGTNHGAFQILATRLKERRQQRVREGEVNEVEEMHAVSWKLREERVSRWECVVNSDRGG